MDIFVFILFFKGEIFMNEWINEKLLFLVLKFVNIKVIIVLWNGMFYMMFFIIVGFVFFLLVNFLVIVIFEWVNVSGLVVYFN